MSYAELLNNYILNAENYWPATHQRNVRKIQKFLASGRSSLGGLDNSEYVSYLTGLAKLRSIYNSKHFYLINTGSAGSHWVEAMLGLLPGFYNGGEIYFPAKIKKHLGSIDSRSANIFLDAIYLLHSGSVFNDSLGAVLSNSAHLAKHQQLSEYSANKNTVLLLRNPVDVVISRTFRKDEYKKDIAPSLDDKEYLERNCVYVENFFANIDESSFDAIVKYEDFVDSPLSNLKKTGRIDRARSY